MTALSSLSQFTHWITIWRAVLAIFGNKQAQDFDYFDSALVLEPWRAPVYDPT